MPTYVYECQTCLKVSEVDQRITEDPLTDCDCGSKGSLKRLIQPIAVMFKGSGFYVNDKTSSSGPIKQEGEPTPSPEADPAPETKVTETKATETKPPETKSPEKPTETNPVETKPATPAAPST